MAGSSAPLFAVIIVLVLIACQYSEGAISCFEAVSDVTPCVNYACGSGSGPVPDNCCSGIKKLNSTATSTADRRYACECLKKTASSISCLNEAVANQIPGKCGVALPFTLSRSLNCTTVH